MTVEETDTQYGLVQNVESPRYVRNGFPIRLA
jgi:hypothetical protein